MNWPIYWLSWAVLVVGFILLIVGVQGPGVQTLVFWTGFGFCVGSILLVVVAAIKGDD